MLMFSELTAQEAAGGSFPWELTEGHRVLTVSDGTDLIGRGLLLEDTGRLWLMDLFIREEDRRHGFGRTLLSVAASSAVEKGRYVLYAHMPADEVAKAFCKAVGFVAAADEDGVWILDLTETKGMRHGR